MNSLSIHISIEEQKLTLKSDNNIVKKFIISSASNGLSSKEGSHCTPTGKFYICEKHGFNAPAHTIFKSRQPTSVWQGEPDCGDLVLSRILWLQGIDSHNLNTKERYIYIHGTNHEHLLGFPHSQGCIRMKNQDIIKLYEIVGINTPVSIY